MPPECQLACHWCLVVASCRSLPTNVLVTDTFRRVKSPSIAYDSTVFLMDRPVDDYSQKHAITYSDSARKSYPDDLENAHAHEPREGARAVSSRPLARAVAAIRWRSTYALLPRTPVRCRH